MAGTKALADDLKLKPGSAVVLQQGMRGIADRSAELGTHSSEWLCLIRASFTSNHV